MTLISRALRGGRAERRTSEWGDSSPPPPGEGGLGTPADAPLRVATALSCGLAVSEDIAMLPMLANRRPRGGGVVPVTPAPVIVSNPFAADVTNISPQTGIAQIVISLLYRGNAYLRIADRGPGGLPTALLVLSPDRVTCRSEAGERVYRINGSVVDTSEIVHIMGPSLPGADVGLSVIEYQRVLFGLGLAIGEFSLGWFQRGAAPSGILKITRPLNKTQAAELKDQFQAAHAGVGRAHGVGVLSGGAEYVPLSLKPEDSAWLETMSLVREDICGLFGVPPWRVGIRSQTSGGSSNTSSGGALDASGVAYLRHTLLRWTSRLEYVWTGMIPGGSTYAQFDLTHFTRADTDTRWRTYMLGRTMGVQTVNEIREAEGWEALASPGADDPMQPLNSAHATAGDASPSAGLDTPPEEDTP